MDLPSVKPLTDLEPNAPLSGDGWIGVTMNEKTLLKGFDRESLIPPWAALLSITALFTLAWLKEGEVLFKRKGLSSDDNKKDPVPTGLAGGLGGKDGPNV
jgi:hypothetical protein